MARPTIAESVTCSAVPTTNLTTDVLFGSVSGGTDQLYLAYVELRDGSDWRVTSMSGGGLTWTRVFHDRDTQATLVLELWAAFGSPGSSFQPTIDGFEIEAGSPADTSLAAVAGVCVRIPDADSTTPYQNATSADAGGTDNANASVTGTVGAANSLMLGAVATRAFTISSADADYAAENSATAGAGGNIASLFVRARTASSPAVGTDTFANTLSAAADWVSGLVEVLEATGGAPQSIDPDALSVPLTLPAPTLVPGGVTVSPGALSVPVTLPAPSLVPGGVTISPAALSVPVTLPEPSVLADGLNVTPDALSVPVTFPAPTFTPGGVTVTPGALSVSVTFPAPTLVPGGVTVSPAVLSIPVSLPAPGIATAQTISPAALSVPVTLHAPSFAGYDSVPGLQIEVDFANDGSWVDIADFMREGSITRGVSRFDGVYMRAEAGQATVVLDNRDARFDPTNLDGPYVDAGATQVQPMRPFRIRAGSVHLWRGFVDTWRLSYPGQFDAVCVLTGTDGTKVLANYDGPEQSPQGAGEDTGARMTRILDNAGWDPALRVIDTGQTTVQETTLADNAWTEIQLTADTEIGEVYFDPEGRFVFRDRHALLTEDRSDTSQATFGDQPGDLGYTEVELAVDDQQVANLVRIARAGGTEQVAEDAASQAVFLVRTFDRTDLVHETDTESANYAAYVLALLKDGELRFDSIAILPGGDPENLYPQALGRELGDRITVAFTPPGRVTPIERDVYIRGIQHTFTLSTWETRWALQASNRFAFMILDDPVLGTLDENRLGF